MNGLSTRDAAKNLGLSFTSLNRYIAAQKIPLPPLVRVGGVRVRLWSDKDILRAKALKIDEYFVKANTNLDDVYLKIDQIMGHGPVATA